MISDDRMLSLWYLVLMVGTRSGNRGCCECIQVIATSQFSYSHKRLIVQLLLGAEIWDGADPILGLS
jgi:hypothetical protein